MKHVEHVRDRIEYINYIGRFLRVCALSALRKDSDMEFCDDCKHRVCNYKGDIEKTPCTISIELYRGLK